MSATMTALPDCAPASTLKVAVRDSTAPDGTETELPNGLAQLAETDVDLSSNVMHELRCGSFEWGLLMWMWGKTAEKFVGLTRCTEIPTRMMLEPLLVSVLPVLVALKVTVIDCPGWTTVGALRLQENV